MTDTTKATKDLRLLAGRYREAAKTEEDPLRRQITLMWAGKLEARADLIDTLTADRDAERARAARLTEALRFYSCEDGCNDCPANERDRIGCGWTARAALEDRADG